MTSLHDLVGAQGQFSCPDCPKVITDETWLVDIQVSNEEQIASMIFDRNWEDEERPSEETCAELGRAIFRNLIKSLTADELISLQKELA